MVTTAVPKLAHNRHYPELRIILLSLLYPFLSADIRHRSRKMVSSSPTKTKRKKVTSQHHLLQKLSKINKSNSPELKYSSPLSFCPSTLLSCKCFMDYSSQVITGGLTGP